MKKFYLIILITLVFYACSTNDPTPVSNCQPTSVTLFDGSATKFTFESDGGGGQHLKKISANENTDTAYVYNYAYSGSDLATITKVEDGVSSVQTATIGSGKIQKLSVVEPGTSNVLEESRFSYSGDNVTMIDVFWAAPSGTLYQIGQNKYTYDSNGNVTKSETYIDIVMLFTIAFGQEPTDAYAGINFGSVNYEYGQTAAANPLYGSYYPDNPDMSFTKNIPINIIIKDDSGSTVGSEGYTITFGDNGYPAKATNGAKYIEATYVCN